MKSKGLGDTIHKILKALQLDKLADKLSNKEGCGCESRRRKLNEKFPYRHES